MIVFLKFPLFAILLFVEPTRLWHFLVFSMVVFFISFDWRSVVLILPDAAL